MSTFFLILVLNRVNYGTFASSMPTQEWLRNKEKELHSNRTVILNWCSAAHRCAAEAI
jgi:hypothetical protein